MVARAAHPGRALFLTLFVRAPEVHGQSATPPSPLRARAHGVGVADFDHDGDLDLVVGHSTGRCEDECVADPYLRLWKNPSQGAWVQLRLEGAAGGRSGGAGGRAGVPPPGRLPAGRTTGASLAGRIRRWCDRGAEASASESEEVRAEDVEVVFVGVVWV